MPATSSKSSSWCPPPSKHFPSTQASALASNRTAMAVRLSGIVFMTVGLCHDGDACTTLYRTTLTHPPPRADGEIAGSSSCGAAPARARSVRPAEPIARRGGVRDRAATEGLPSMMRLRGRGSTPQPCTTSSLLRSSVETRGPRVCELTAGPPSSRTLGRAQESVRSQRASRTLGQAIGRARFAD